MLQNFHLPLFCVLMAAIAVSKKEKVGMFSGLDRLII